MRGIYFLGSLWYLIGMLGLVVVHARIENEPAWRTRVKNGLENVCVHKGAATAGKDACVGAVKQFTS